MGSCQFIILLLFLMMLQILDPHFAMPLCTDSRAPFTPKSPLQFCSYNDTACCCEDTDDMQLKKQFDSMNISDDLACAALVKSILCARCDPFSNELFRIDSAPRALPVLCNDTMSESSTQSTNQAQNSFCSKVWTTCQNINISNSPFRRLSLQGRAEETFDANSSKLTDLWQSQKDFCNALGGVPDTGSACYSGEPVILNNSTKPPDPLSGICLEKIGNGSYPNMIAHPDGSNRAFLTTQQGIIWLATIPEDGSGKELEFDEVNPFLDLMDEVYFDTDFGLMGSAFHPKFTENGRFFASFTCDKTKDKSCAGRCACNSDVNCDPAKMAGPNGAQPCQYQIVIAEFSVNGTTPHTSSGTWAKPLKVRKIFTMGLPFLSHHEGQIIFGPRDGYLYFVMGDGGSVGDPYNFAQNKKSLLGKIMRFDVDDIPSAAEVDQLGLWGNYSIPKDNPYTEDKELQKEIWALGFRNPWRCSFDAARPSYFLCVDIGQDQYEEVNLITKGGNYGWRVYEGPFVYNPPQSPGGNTSIESIRPIFPITGYNHNEENLTGGTASIAGGFVYRSFNDPCLHGKYLFADLFAGSIWVSTENPVNSGKFTSNRTSFNCAHDSPLPCIFAPGNSLPVLNIVYGFGQDNNKDVHILSNTGVYRIVRPSRCNYACAKENPSDAGSPMGRASHRSSEAIMLRGLYLILVVFVSFFCLLFDIFSVNHS